MATTAMDYEAAGGDRYDDDAPRYERDNRSASPRPAREDHEGTRRRTASPNGNADSGPKESSGHRGDDEDGSINPGSNLFVTGIHPRLSEADVAKMFEKYGDVEKCQIMRDPHTKESRGFGFVKMVTPDQAEAAREGLQGEQIEGRTLSIEKARRARPRTPTPGKYFGPPKREDGPRPRWDDRRRGGGYGGSGGRDDYRYRGYERGYDRRSDDRRYEDRGGYREDRRDYDRGGYGRDYDRSYDRRDRGGDDHYNRDRYGGGGRDDRYNQRSGGGGYDRDRYDRQGDRDSGRTRESGGGGSGYGESAARSEAREPYGGSEPTTR